MSAPKLGKKLQSCDYKVDMIATKIDDNDGEYEYADYDDYYDEEAYDEPYQIDVSFLQLNFLGLWLR